MRVFILSLCISLAACSSKQTAKPYTSKLDKNWLDSIIKSSDTSYTKPYFRTDFVTASYYFSKKDSSLCQVMKDSTGIIKQISISEKNIRTFYGQYYNNGQLVAWLPFDAAGMYDGDAVYYYESGTIKSSGTFTHGLKTGLWKNFDEKGKLVNTEEFDNNGQFIK